jgi:gentisate 1,2-dioxygenase
MSGATFSSKDFSSVASVQRPDVVDRLIDHQVCRPREGQQADAFSEQRQHFVRAVDLPSRVLSMTMGGLEPGQSTRLHRHNYETIIYIVSGEGESLLGETSVRWRAGDAIYVPVWAWHRHTNTSQAERCLYVACENAPMLQNLGIALREEA